MGSRLAMLMGHAWANEPCWEATCLNSAPVPVHISSKLMLCRQISRPDADSHMISLGDVETEINRHFEEL